MDAPPARAWPSPLDCSARDSRWGPRLALMIIILAGCPSSSNAPGDGGAASGGSPAAGGAGSRGTSGSGGGSGGTGGAAGAGGGSGAPSLLVPPQGVVLGACVGTGTLAGLEGERGRQVAINH